MNLSRFQLALLWLVALNPLLLADEREPRPLVQLATYLAQPRATRPKLADQPFAKSSLSKEEVATATKLLAEDHRRWVQETREAEWKAREVRDGDWVMPFDIKVFGNPPEHGRSLYISMHGGGSAPKRVNDQQWENQKRLYKPEEGVYLTPRAPTDSWNMWHQDHIDRLFTRLIEDAMVLENVDPNRVYIMGYSAGGDGVFQLAPRMSDQLAAAAMMAGHPNETVPIGLRNLPFTLHMGGKDAAFHRNDVAREWKSKLEELQQSDPKGYVHLVDIHENKSHWMDREDAVAIPWMAQFSRNPFPSKVVWKQDDVTHSRFYWLGVDTENEKGGTLVVASMDGSRILIEQAEGIHRLELYLSDASIDLDQPIEVVWAGKTILQTKLSRTLADIDASLQLRGDATALSSAHATVVLD